MSRELRRRTVDWVKPLPIIRSEAEFNQMIKAGLGDPTSEEEISSPQQHFSPSDEPKRKKRPPKEIFVPHAEALTLDLADLGLDPGTYHRPKRIRWRSAALATDAVTHLTAKEDDPVGPDVHYHFTLKDEEILNEINQHKTVLNQKDMQKAFDTWEKATGTSKQLIDHARAIELVHQRGMLELPAYVLNEVYAAWCRRREENKKPLLRMFWPIGQSGEDPPTSSFSTFKISSSRWRLRRPRRNTEQLLARARELHKECMQVLCFANTLYTGERLKRQRILGKMCINSLQAKRKDHALILHELKQDISAFKDEQKGLAAREEVLSRAAAPNILSQQPGRAAANKRKLVYITDVEEKSSSGGMLGGLNRRAASAADEDENSPKSKNRLRLRLRQGRSNRWYLDRVAEGHAPQLRLLPTFSQFESFGSFESCGGLGDPETRAAEYSEIFLDDIHETVKAIRGAVTNESAIADDDPALAASGTTAQELSQAFAAYKQLAVLAKARQALAATIEGSAAGKVTGRSHSTAI